MARTKQQGRKNFPAKDKSVAKADRPRKFHKKHADLADQVADFVAKLEEEDQEEEGEEKEEEEQEQQDEEMSEEKEPQKRKNKNQSFEQLLTENAESFKSVYLLSTNTSSNREMSELTADWLGSRIYRGKKAASTGKDVFLALAAKYPGLAQLAEKLEGEQEAILLFTNRPQTQVEEYFAPFRRPAFPSRDMIASETIVQPAGPLPLPATMKDSVAKKMDLKVEADLEKRELVLLEPVTLCTQGERFKENNCVLLNYLGRKIGEFVASLQAGCVDGVFKDYSSSS
eukprot:gene3737-4086_t